MLENIVILGLLALSGFFIISPLLKQDTSDNMPTPEPDDIRNDLNLKKERAYETIKELEFDLNMGKLSKEDYEILKDQYTREAIEYLKTIDEFHGSEKDSSVVE